MYKIKISNIKKTCIDFRMKFSNEIQKAMLMFLLDNDSAVTHSIISLRYCPAHAPSMQNLRHRFAMGSMRAKEMTMK